MSEVDRRNFLRTCGAGAAALAASTYAGAAAQPNERVRLAVMGVNGRGRQLISGFSGLENVEIAYVIDPDSAVIPPALKQVKSQQGPPKVEKDFRRALEDKDVTAIVIATPDHWHALATVWGCQAGKHVYVEKPISHNLIEGRKMVEAARKYKRVVQVGTQRRSAPHAKEAAEFVRSGKLGKVPFARAWIAGNRASIGKAKGPQPIPETVDYDLYCGPAPQGPLMRQKLHHDWPWFWDFGTGARGNNGIHGLDLIRMLLPYDAPTKVSSQGQHSFYEDDRETPETQIAVFDFPGTTVVWEHRFWEKNGLEGEPFGVALHGERGTLVFTRKGWHVRDGIEASGKTAGMETPHLQNFLDAIRSGAALNADIEEGHKSTRLCHLGNIAYRLGRTLQFDASTETIPNDPEANKLLGRTYREPYVLPKEV